MDFVPLTSLSLLLLALVAYIATLVWAYRDAESRGKSGALVVLLLVSSFLLGLLAWIAIRPEKLDDTARSRFHDTDRAPKLTVRVEDASDSYRPAHR